MPVATTTIGAYPKPDFLAAGDWFDAAGDGPDRTEPTAHYAEDVARLGEEAESMFARAATASWFRQRSPNTAFNAFQSRLEGSTGVSGKSGRTTLRQSLR